MEEEFGSNSEGESLSGFVLEGSDSSDSGYSSTDLEDAGDLHLPFDNVLKMIFSREKESKLKSEADKDAHKLQD
ncbi:hypothetical protein BVC80_8981g26 [Macleaya cordata]|uniref:Uncharacterized protein n=1 Tax=Macleaya cordata TaxID=56857 RepID=A0A200Q7C6_MACCD|nr:hypothetical protein BVC80_8981g26 [Macleaya cordata]